MGPLFLSDPVTYAMHRHVLLRNSTLPIVNFHEEGVKIQQIELTSHCTMVKMLYHRLYGYIASCDRVAHVFTSG